MQLRSTLLLLALAFGLQTQAQTLINIESRGTIPVFAANFVLSTFGLSAKNDVAYYNVQYTMDNLEGRQDTVSGLFITPTNVDPFIRYPRLVYQHGTTIDKFAVPSRATPGQDLSYLYATQGYVVFAPDYLNMGDDQDGFHPYVHARTEALAAINMMEALANSPEYQNKAYEGQLFLSGYSQGGHASMALHEILIEEYPDIEVTAAAHMSGPYSISDIMLNEVILKDETFQYMAFLPYTVLAYQAVYDDLDEDLSELFKAPYLPIITAFRDGYSTGAVGLDSLTTVLLQTYVATEGNSNFYPSRILTNDFADELRNDPTNKYVKALRDNDTYDFVNPTPTRLLYCTADDQVSYLNSLVARDTLNLLGATDTEAVDVNSSANHTGCVRPAVAASVQFFQPLQELIISGTTIPQAANWTWIQADKTLQIQTGKSAELYTLQIFDALGRELTRREFLSGQIIDLPSQAGYLAARVFDSAGRSISHPLIVR